MTDDLVKLLREFTCDCFNGNSKHLTWEAADRIEELEQQITGLASVVGELIDEAAAARIEQLENVLQEIAGIANIPETPPTKIGAETDIMWGCLVMCTFMARGAMGELDEQ